MLLTIDFHLKKDFSLCRKEAQKRAVYGGLSPAAYHLRNSPGAAAAAAAVASSPSASNFGNWSPMRLGAAASAASPARNPIYIGGISPAYPFPAGTETPASSSSASAAMGPPKSKPKKHKRKKHKRKKASKNSRTFKRVQYTSAT